MLKFCKKILKVSEKLKLINFKYIYVYIIITKGYKFEDI